MKHGKDATKKSRRLVRKPYAMVGAGPLKASIWKSKRKGDKFFYRFNIFRMCAKNRCVTQRFSPADISHLARLVQLLATEITHDGCLATELRDDLSCLAACMDEVLGKAKALTSTCLSDDSRPATPRIVTDSFEKVLEYLWEDEAKHFSTNPAVDHVYRSLVVIHRWLDGSWLSEELPMSFDDLEPSHYFGVCPICGGNDGYVDLDISRWSVCDEHHVRWRVGDSISMWENETSHASKSHWEQIGTYLVVEPFRLCEAEDSSETTS